MQARPTTGLHYININCYGKKGNTGRTVGETVVESR